jgi:hypothetical protein
LPLFRLRNGKAARKWGQVRRPAGAKKSFKAFEEKGFEATGNVHSFPFALLFSLKLFDEPQMVNVCQVEPV